MPTLVSRETSTMEHRMFDLFKRRAAHPLPSPRECPTPAVPCVVPSLKEIAVEVVQRGTFPVKRRGLPTWHPPSLEDFSPQCPIDYSIAVRAPAGFTGNIRDWLERRRLLHTVEHRWSHADQC